jgi:hypothetical protein
MEERHMVVLYGNSLLMAGVEASLRGRTGLDVVRIDATLPNVAQSLCALHPDVVIFDLATPLSNFQLPSSILQEHSGISLIGLDLNSNKVLVLSGQEHTVLAANDLAQVIQLLTRT